MIKRLSLVVVLLSFAGPTLSATPQELLRAHEAQSGNASPARGEQFSISSMARNGVVLLAMLMPPRDPLTKITFGYRQNE